MSASKVVDVGAPPSNFHEWDAKQRVKAEEVQVRFLGVQDFPIMGDETDHIDSDEFTCCGCEWELRLYHVPTDDGYIAVELVVLWSEGDDVELETSFSVTDATGKEVVYHPWESERFSPNEADGERMIRDFALRSEMMEALVNGSLIVNVRMRLVDPSPPSKPTPLTYIPGNPLQKGILKIFMDEKSADITFKVGGERSTDKRKSKRAKTSSTELYAHRLILQSGAPALAEMCGTGEDNVPITDVQPEIFRHLLYYVYGGSISDDDLKANTKEIIDAADKYGVVGLKLKAEACYVESTTITVENLMDNLLYADSKNCALLKEAVIDFFVENGQEVLNKVQLNEVPGGMFADLLTAVTRKEKNINGPDADGSADDQLSTMRVSELRKKLDGKGFDVDGSRESMIALLKTNP